MNAPLLVALIVFPTAVVWGFRSSKASLPEPVAAARQEAVVRVPVEVIASGSAPQWVYVEVGNQAIPEPGMISLLALTSLLLVFRRQRG